MIQLTDEQKKTAKLFGWRIDLDRFPTANKQITRAFIILNIKCTVWLFKWGNKYSIAYPDKRFVDTGCRTLSEWTLENWCEFALKHQTEQ